MELKTKRRIISKLRLIFGWEEVKKEAVLKAESEDRNKYKCAQCKRMYKRRTVQVDHTVPILDPETGFPKLSDGSDDWSTYIKRMFCSVDNLQILCKRCHSKKTKAENAIRAESRKNGNYKF